MPSVTLKKPPTLTCPVISVVALRNMVSWVPMEMPLRSTMVAVTAAMAAPRNSERRVCCRRLRNATRKSTPRTPEKNLKKPIIASLLGAHGLARTDAHRQPGGIEARSHRHQEDHHHRAQHVERID